MTDIALPVRNPRRFSISDLAIKKQEVAAKQADANAAEASAKAAEAKARTQQILAETEAKRIAAEEKRRADEFAAEAGKRLFDTGITLTSYAGGVISGAFVAKSLDKKFSEGLKTRNAALRDVAREVSPLIDKAGGKSAAAKRTNARVRAIVSTADKTGLTKTGRGKAGPTSGIGLILVGLTSRKLAAEQSNETVKTILNASGTAEIVAGGTVLVKDLANRVSSPDIVDVKALSKVEQARAMTKSNVPAAPTQPPVRSASVTTLNKVGRVAGRVALPIAAAAVAITSMQRSAEAGEPVNDVVKAGGKAVADILTGGAISEAETAKADGATDSTAVAQGVTIGAINLTTFGVVTAADDALRESGNGGVAKTITTLAQQGMTALFNAVSGGSRGKAYLSDSAKQQAAALAPPTITIDRRMGATEVRSDGRTAGYTAVRNGRSVHVKGYRTPKRAA